MRLVPLIALPAPAAVHVGHLGEAAGHDHWTAGAALGAAALAALWAAWKARRGREEPEPDETEA